MSGAQDEQIASKQLINTRSSHVNSIRASPENSNKRQAQEAQEMNELKANLEKAVRERDQAQSETDRLTKEALAHKYTV